MEGRGVKPVRLDLSTTSVRELNDYLHHRLVDEGVGVVEIVNPNGMHNIAVGLDCPVEVHVRGNAGYFVGGMNKQAHIHVYGNVGWSVAENIMSGSVRIKGNASECTAASGQGGLVVIEGDSSSRCGISMKGCDIVVGGSVGHMSGFMAQAGNLLVCGDAGAHLGDSLYEAVIYVRGKIDSLGADAREEPMTGADYAKVGQLLKRAEFEISSKDFKRVASARTLYHWNAEAHQEY
jgi:methylamine---glutamate N-methyltransferase subunit B